MAKTTVEIIADLDRVGRETTQHITSLNEQLQIANGNVSMVEQELESLKLAAERHIRLMDELNIPVMP